MLFVAKWMVNNLQFTDAFPIKENRRSGKQRSVITKLEADTRSESLWRRTQELHIWVTLISDSVIKKKQLSETNPTLC